MSAIEEAGCACCGVDIVDDGTSDWYRCSDCCSSDCHVCGLCENCCGCDEDDYEEFEP